MERLRQNPPLGDEWIVTNVTYSLYVFVNLEVPNKLQARINEMAAWGVLVSMSLS